MRLPYSVLPLLVAHLVGCGNSNTDSAASGGGSGGVSAANGGAGTTGGSYPTTAGGSAGTAAGASGVAGSAGPAFGGSGQGGASAGGAAGSGGSATGGSATGGAGNGGSATGSAGNGGSATGGAGSGGGGGSGGIPGCTVEPVTPNATAATRKVLCYLNSLYGNHILSGQEEDNSDDGMNTIVAASGKYPAIRAFDVNNSMAPTQCVQHWQQRGGLCMFGYHMGINGGTFSSTTTDITKVLTAGTAENKSFNSDLDRYAQYIQPLQQAGGVALVRLFHEAGKNCKWFWWSMGSTDQYKGLYKYAFNYLTATKGLNNLLWIVPQCGSPDASYDPGKQYSDFGGADTYVTDTGPLTSIFNQTVSAFPGRPAVLHECGKLPDPAQLKSSNTKWLLFNLWSNPFFHADHNSADWIKQVYTSDYVITADELPSFK